MWPLTRPGLDSCQDTRLRFDWSVQGGQPWGPEELSSLCMIATCSWYKAVQEVMTSSERSSYCGSSVFIPSGPAQLSQSNAIQALCNHQLISSTPVSGSKFFESISPGSLTISFSTGLDCHNLTNQLFLTFVDEGKFKPMALACDKFPMPAFCQDDTDHLISWQFGIVHPKSCNSFINVSSSIFALFAKSTRSLIFWLEPQYSQLKLRYLQLRHL